MESQSHRRYDLGANELSGPNLFPWLGCLMKPLINCHNLYYIHRGKDSDVQEYTWMEFDCHGIYRFRVYEPLGFKLSS